MSTDIGMSLISLAPLTNGAKDMQFSTILDFYQRNALYQSSHTYDDKATHLAFFHPYSHIKIDLIHDYCTLRSLTGVKNSTINRELTLARAAINYYNKHHDSKIPNPFNGFTLFEQDFIPRYLSKYECSALLKASLTYDNQRLHDFILLALNTGCRAGELTKLEWQNVYLKEGYIIVRNNLSKNRKTIYKPLNDQSKQALLRLNNESKWVFYNSNTNKNIRSFRRGFEHAWKRAGIGKVRIHDLRHTFASFLVKEGIPLYHVSQLLGHSDIRITQKYAHLSPNSLQSVIGVLPQFDK